MGSNEPEETIEDVLARRNRQWITLYVYTLQAEKARLAAQLLQLEGDVNELEVKAKSISADILELGILKSRIEEKHQGIGEVLNQLSEINLVTNNFNATKVRIIDTPGTGVKIAPSLSKYLSFGLLGGGALGICLGLLVDMSEKTFRSPAEITKLLGCTVIGTVPQIRKSRSAGPAQGPALTLLNDSSSEAAEAVRAIRASILAAGQYGGAKTIMITSPSPGDGKSTTCSNLAIAIAQAGKSVVLVDADLRRPRIHTYFDVELEPGLTQQLHSREAVTEFMQASGEAELSLLTAGEIPKNPGEIVTSQAFRTLLHRLGEKFDFVMVDSPPIIPVADSTVIATMVDAVYLVMRIRRGVVATSTLAKDKLKNVGVDLSGVIINGVDDNPHFNDSGSSKYQYKYGGYSGYTSDDLRLESDSKKKRRGQSRQ